MHHFTPTYDISSTVSNVAEFVKKNEQVLWRVYLPFLPFVFAASILDFVMNDYVFAGGEREYVVGEYIARFLFLFMAISWHRVVINGPDNYVPMNPFRPQRHELAFIGLWVLIGIIPMIMSDFFLHEGEDYSREFYLALFVVMLALFYFPVKIMFYFPAKAVGDHVSFSESFRMTRGYFWKVVFSNILAIIGLISYWGKVLLAWFAYFFVIIIGAIIWLVLSGTDTEKIGDIVMSDPILTFVLELPLVMYFYPIMLMIYTTITSNFYLHAIQNPKGE